MRFVTIFSCLMAVSVLAGCASKPKPSQNGVQTLNYAPVKKPQISKKKSKKSVEFPKPVKNSPLSRKKEEDVTRPVIVSKGLAGRTLYANSINDINLKPGEVILTFDDGPVPGKTPTILNTLDKFGVKATFLMVGSMVKSYPSLVKKVASRGHSIGSHTTDHANLRNVSFDSAKAKIRSGERAIQAAGANPSFFRFPYLADTPALRKWVSSRGVIILDVDVDSKDYFKESSKQVAQRTISRVKARGKGIILFHDIHARTVGALPEILSRLKAEGFKVVALKSSNRPKNDLVASVE